MLVGTAFKSMSECDCNVIDKNLLIYALQKATLEGHYNTGKMLIFLDGSTIKLKLSQPLYATTYNK